MTLHPCLRIAATAALGTTLAGLASAQSAPQPVETGPASRPDVTPAFPEQTRAPARDSGVDLETATLALGLRHPWGIAVLPGEAGYLVTERSGQMRHVTEGGTVSDPIAGIPAVHAVEQGGLLDVALAPDFDDTRMIYWTYAKPLGEGMSVTAAAKGRITEDLGTVARVEDDFFNQVPPSPTPMHYGSRVVPTGDGHVFVTTGEHFTEEERRYAQDPGKTYGKIVRLTSGGATPDDNPFADRGETEAQVWTLGHRNVQGAAIHPETGAFWVIEHGPQGGDELNLVERGANYGWPDVSYGQNYDGTPVTGGDFDHAAKGYTPPRYYWDPVIAPGDMTFYDGSMFPEWEGDALISALVAGGLVRLEMDGDTVTGEERLVSDLGRVRDVAVDDDGALLVLTDYADGRIVRISRTAESN
ncbi:MAG: PQQ-dependent sugar dehydrogenase [Paracoccaceae bacterium]|jgi:glucose/arabinose dehydrogenase|nr:PQQ-dependent sugar dehydrogenase [Paracoccaceae bacterium]